VSYSKITFSYNAWTESIGLCGAFTYTFSITPSTTCLTMNTAGYLFSVISYNVNDVNLYTVTMKGKLSNGVTKSTSFKLNV
jgi:hypothetical protein